MNEAINKAIKVLTAMITESVASTDALKYTQAALNLAQVKSSLNLA